MRPRFRGTQHLATVTRNDGLIRIAFEPGTWDSVPPREKQKLWTYFREHYNLAIPDPHTSYAWEAPEVPGESAIPTGVIWLPEPMDWCTYAQMDKERVVP